MEREGLAEVGRQAYFGRNICRTGWMGIEGGGKDSEKRFLAQTAAWRGDGGGWKGSEFDTGISGFCVEYARSHVVPNGPVGRPRLEPGAQGERTHRTLTAGGFSEGGEPWWGESSKHQGGGRSQARAWGTLPAPPMQKPSGSPGERARESSRQPREPREPRESRWRRLPSPGGGHGYHGDLVRHSV